MVLTRAATTSGASVQHCRWCGIEQDPEALAIHHCGPRERPPAYCIPCGTALEGAAACPACDTPAGEKYQVAKVPVAVAAGAGEAGGAGDADGATAAVAAGGGPMPASTLRTASTDAAGTAAATKPTRAGGDPDRLAASLRGWSLGASVIGTLACFVGWIAGGSAAITVIELAPTKYWGPPSPRVLFVLMVCALVLSVIGSFRVGGALVPGLSAVLGALLTVCSVDWLWLGRQHLVQFTGFWLFVGASFVLLVTSLASLLHARAS